MDEAASKLQEWMRAEAKLTAAKVEVERLKEEFRSSMQFWGAGVGTFRGVPVLTRNTTKTFRGREFAKERPDLVEQYTRPKVVETLDLAALAAELPDVYRRYLSEQLKPDWKAFGAALVGPE